MVNGCEVTRDWFEVISLSYIREVAWETFLESVAGLSDILHTAFFTANDVYYILCFATEVAFYVHFSLVFQEINMICFLYIQASCA